MMTLCNASKYFKKHLNLKTSFDRSGNLDEQEWQFLLTGGVALENRHRNPAPEWLTEKSWAEIVRCSDLSAFGGLKKDFEQNVRA